MGTRVAVFTGVLAVLGIAAAIYLNVALNQEKAELKKLQAQLEHREKQVTELSLLSETESAQHKEQVARLEADLADAQASLEEATSKKDADASADSNSLAGILSSLGKSKDGDKGGDNPLAAVMGMFGKDGDQGEDGEDGQNPLAAIAKMYEGENGDKLASYTANMTVNFTYGDLFKEWGLSKEREDQIREIIARHTADMMKESMKMLMDGDTSKKTDIEADSDAALRQELSTVLTPEELAQWSAYEETKEEHALAYQYDMQLGMLAPGLSSENRATVKDVLVEEVMAAKPAEGTAQSTDVNTEIQSQLDAYQRARARLVDYLDEQQMAEFDRFINQQEQIMGIVTQMTGAGEPKS